MKRIPEILKTAVTIEEEGERFYKAAAEETKDPKGKEIFLFLARDEEAHRKLFETMSRAYQEKGDFSSLSEISLTGIKIKPAIFDARNTTKEVKGDENDIRAIELGIGKEKASIAFYSQAIEEFSEENAKRLLRDLVVIEEGHLNLLQGELNALTETGFWYDFPEFTVEGM
jgi:rubrerythrin